MRSRKKDKNNYRESRRRSRQIKIDKEKAGDEQDLQKEKQRKQDKSI